MDVDCSCICGRFAMVTEVAALAAADWVGRGDGPSGEFAARAAMASALAEMPVRIKVAASRTADSHQALLQPGDELGGCQGGPEVGDAEAGGAAGADDDREAAEWDVAVQPLEARNALARGAEGALAMIAAGPTGSLLPVPEMYMQKIIVSGQAAAAVDIDVSVAENIRRVASALGRRPADLVVVILDRPRHEDLAAQIKAAGARLVLIPDGDISAGIAAASRESGVDMTIGIGGSVEGVIAAAAMRCLGGEIHARFWPVSRQQVEQLRCAGIDDVEATLAAVDLAGDGVLFSATAVTGGRFLKGVEVLPYGVHTETLVMCSQCHAIRTVKTIHRADNGGPPVALGIR